MSPLELATTNLTNPIVLAFALGALACLAGTDLRLPEPVRNALSTYLLLAIGHKGGVAITGTEPGELIGPAVLTVAVGVVTAAAAFAVLLRGRFSVADAAGIAAHYGSVSVVTATAAVTYATAAGTPPEGFVPALVVLLEVPGIVVALALAHARGAGAPLGHALREVVAGKTALLLGGGLVIGATAGASGTAAVEPLFVGLFPGLLVLFLLDLGAATGREAAAVRKSGRFLLGFAVAAPIVSGLAAVAAGAAIGLSAGGAAVFGAMAASASYIAAPAAVRAGLPDANPALGATAALAVTFPFNLAVGIPLYHAVATVVA